MFWFFFLISNLFSDTILFCLLAEGVLCTTDRIMCSMWIFRNRLKRPAKYAQKTKNNKLLIAGTYQKIYKFSEEL